MEIIELFFLAVYSCFLFFFTLSYRFFLLFFKPSHFFYKKTHKSPLKSPPSKSSPLKPSPLKSSPLMNFEKLQRDGNNFKEILNSNNVSNITNSNSNIKPKNNKNNNGNKKQKKTEFYVPSPDAVRVLDILKKKQDQVNKKEIKNNIKGEVCGFSNKYNVNEVRWEVEKRLKVELCTIDGFFGKPDKESHQFKWSNKPIGEQMPSIREFLKSLLDLDDRLEIDLSNCLDVQCHKKDSDKKVRISVTPSLIVYKKDENGSQRDIFMVIDVENETRNAFILLPKFRNNSNMALLGASLLNPNNPVIRLCTNLNDTYGWGWVHKERKLVSIGFFGSEFSKQFIHKHLNIFFKSILDGHIIGQSQENFNPTCLLKSIILDSKFNNNNH